MPKMVTEILFLKNNINIEPDFQEIYTLGKQRKVHSKKLFIDTINEPKVSIYIDLSNRKNTLLSVRDY